MEPPLPTKKTWFQGQYEAVPVAGEYAEDAHYFKSVADYVHLNPARAGFVDGKQGSLVDYPWSSLRHYPKGNRESHGCDSRRLVSRARELQG